MNLTSILLANRSASWARRCSDVAPSDRAIWNACLRKFETNDAAAAESDGCVAVAAGGVVGGFPGADTATAFSTAGFWTTAFSTTAFSTTAFSGGRAIAATGCVRLTGTTASTTAFSGGRAIAATGCVRLTGTTATLVSGGVTAVVAGSGTSRVVV